MYREGYLLFGLLFGSTVSCFTIFIVFFGMKLDNSVNFTWTVVFTPLWIFNALFFVIACIVVAVLSPNRWHQHQTLFFGAIFTIVSSIAFSIFEILLALTLDRMTAFTTTEVLTPLLFVVAFMLILELRTICFTYFNCCSCSIMMPNTASYSPQLNIDESIDDLKAENTEAELEKLRTEVKRLRRERTEMGKTFTDPITLAILDNAVITPCGHTFSETSIREWLKTNTTCPICKSYVSVDYLKPDFTIRDAISKYFSTTLTKK